MFVLATEKLVHVSDGPHLCFFIVLFKSRQPLITLYGKEQQRRMLSLLLKHIFVGFFELG